MLSVPHSFKISEMHADLFPIAKFSHSATFTYLTTCTSNSKTTQFFCQLCETIYINKVFTNEAQEEHREIINKRYIFVIIYRSNIIKMESKILTKLE